MTPDVQRLVGSATASPAHSIRLAGSGQYGPGKKGFLMSTEEAYVKAHGDIETLRDGDQTHQNVQTNLADIISGGKYTTFFFFYVFPNGFHTLIAYIHVQGVLTYMS